MDEGFVIDHEDARKRVIHWVAGKPEYGPLGGVKEWSKEQHQIQTFRCPKCGYLESYAPRQ